MAAMTNAALMRDPEFARSVDAEWERLKNDIKGHVRRDVKKVGGSIPDKYVKAMETIIKYERFRKEAYWDKAFYCLHLYLEIVLRDLLHRPRQTKPTFEKQALEVFDTLQKVQGDMERCMWGIRDQLIEQRRQELAREGRLPSPGATAPPAKSGGPLPKRYSMEQARSALDALRLDGRKTGNVKLYGEDVSPPSVAPADVGAPPAYRDVATPGSSVLNTSRSGNLPVSAVRVKRVTGDGSCAFRSIVQGQQGGRLSQQEETRQAMKLREVAVAELQRCADEEMTGTGLTVEQLVLMKDSRFPTFSEYVRAMAKSEFAGETEFWLLARKLNLRLAVYQPKGSEYEHLMTYGEGSSEPVRLLWQRGQTEAGNHYDAIV